MMNGTNKQALSGHNVHITDTATGDTRIMRFERSWEDHYDYLWSEGNYSCDCNRNIFFCRAASRDEPDDEDIECGEGRFLVRITDDSGAQLYQDSRRETPTRR
jgi:hypothetical protein